jgi:hypothetical protein
MRAINGMALHAMGSCIVEIAMPVNHMGRESGRSGSRNVR